MPQTEPEPREVSRREKGRLMTYTLIADASEITLPEGLTCPKCGGALYLEEVSAWEEQDDGSIIATDLHLNCDTEPDIESEEWDEWHRWHFAMPYVDWLPIEEHVLKWINERYRWQLEKTP